MLRLCFLIRQLNQGGAQRQLLELVRGLDKGRFGVFVLTFYEGGIFWDEAREIKGVTVISLNKKGRWDVGRFFLRLLGTIKRINPDILCAYSGTSNILTGLLGPFLPRTWTVWSVRVSDLDLTLYGAVTRLSANIERILSRCADMVIFNSSKGYQHYIGQGYKVHASAVIPNGIDTDRFVMSNGMENPVRIGLGLKGKEKVIGHVGRIDPMKDHPTFLRAVALLVRESENIRFLCVGDGPENYKAELRVLARDLGVLSVVHWAGVRNDMPAVYQSLDLLVSSSISEGFPNVVAEAMACGVPCVVTDAGDSARIVGETGMVVASGNPDALAEAIKAMMAKEEFRDGTIRTECRKRIVEQFSVTRMVREMTHAFETLACAG